MFSVPITAAQAALVDYLFTGISTDLFPVSGSFQFDNEAGGRGSAYNGAVKDFTVTVGGYTSQFTSGANAITISHNTNLGGGMLGDRWALVSVATGPDLNDYTSFSFDLRLDRIGGGIICRYESSESAELGRHE